MPTECEDCGSIKVGDICLKCLEDCEQQLKAFHMVRAESSASELRTAVKQLLQHEW